MSTNQAFHTEARGRASNQGQERPFIDGLPVELLERVISLGVKDHAGRPGIKQVCRWRRVCRRWKDVIDDCPSLWSTIVLGRGSKHVKTQLENSKAAPLYLQIHSRHGTRLDECLTQAVVENAFRWWSVGLVGYPGEIFRRLGSSPSALDSLSIAQTIIPCDCRFFTLIRPNLRRLILAYSTIPCNFDPTLGLEELYFSHVDEQGEDGNRRELSIRKFHQFLQANPNLQVLQLDGLVYSSPGDRDLQSINLPKLEYVVMHVPTAFHLFRAEHCVEVRFCGRVLAGMPPSAWTTPVHTLRRVERIKITVEHGLLHVTAMAEPYKVNVILEQPYGDSDYLFYSILEDFFNEAEQDTHISARVELRLFTEEHLGGDFDLGLETLRLLQTPVWDPSSGRTRWRIPHLDTVSILRPGLPYHHLRAFVQARSHGNCVQPASPITGIFIRRDKQDDDGGKDVLNEVMACTGGGNDGEMAVS